MDFVLLLFRHFVMVLWWLVGFVYLHFDLVSSQPMAHSVFGCAEQDESCEIVKAQRCVLLSFITS